ncbi:MAG: twin-arginine translocation signal domain-containing protein [Candidatus Methylomirabilia bacterium]
MAEGKKGKGNSRRTFLFGLLTGAGVAAAVAALPKPARAKRVTSATPATSGGPILYRRTAEAERYYKTLYL